MKFKNENIIKIIKTNKILAAVGFSLLVGSFAVLILFISLANIQYEKDEKKLKNFNKICLSEKTLQKAYLNITWISEAFATYGDKTSAYYYVSDGNHYYIVYLSKKKGLELSRQDLKKKPAKINGSTFTIDDSLKEIAELRLEFPDISLVELVQKLSIPIGKSGVNYRLNKIIKISK